MTNPDSRPTRLGEKINAARAFHQGLGPAKAKTAGKVPAYDENGIPANRAARRARSRVAKSIRSRMH
jgi:hypothetical protein